MNKYLIVVLAIVLVLVVGGYMILNNKSAASIPSAGTIPQNISDTITQASQPTETPTVASAQITITGKEFAFTPNTIAVRKGQPVSLTFKNAGTFPHNLTIAELNVQTKTVQPGEEDTISFTPSQTGQFTYMCTVPGHADRGMKGTLTVQ